MKNARAAGVDFLKLWGSGIFAATADARHITPHQARRAGATKRRRAAPTRAQGMGAPASAAAKLALGGQVIGSEGDSWRSIAEQYVDFTASVTRRTIIAGGHRESCPKGAGAGDRRSRSRIPRSTRRTDRSVSPPMNTSGASTCAASPRAAMAIRRSSSARGRPRYGGRDRPRREGPIDGLLTFRRRLPLTNSRARCTTRHALVCARRAFRHEKGLRVIARVSCFNDNHLAKAHRRSRSAASRGVYQRLGRPEERDRKDYVIALPRGHGERRRRGAARLRALPPSSG